MNLLNDLRTATIHILPHSLSLEGLDSSDCSSLDEAVDVMSALVGVDRLKVANMTDNVVFIDDAVASQHVTALPCDVQGLPTRIPLQHGDDVGVEISFLPQPRRPCHCIEANGNFCDSISQLHLDELVGRKWTAKLLAIHGICSGLLDAVFGSTPSSPGNAEACGIEASERPPHSCDFGQHVFLRNLHLVELEHSRWRGTQRELALDFGRGKAFHSALNNEATDLSIGACLGPNNSDVTNRRVRDPIFGAMQYIMVSLVCRFCL